MRARRVDGLALLAAALCIAGAGYGLKQALAAEPWLRFALRIETASAPRELSERARQQLAQQLDGRTAETCAWDLPRSHVTAALELVRRTAKADTPAAERQEALRIADEAVRHAISCNAADGNLWFLLALLQQRSGAAWDDVQASLLASNTLSPREGDLVLKRARLVALALRDANLPLDARLEGDLHSALAGAWIGPASSLLTGLRESGRGDLADRLVADLPEDRRTSLAEGTTVRRSTFGRPERYRNFEFKPFGEGGP